MRLFHFSDEPDIREFVPQPVRVSRPRPPGQAWLNGPLVWAIEEAYEFLYLFPRECPRIVIFPLETTTDADRAQWFPDPAVRAIAYIESAWQERFLSGFIYRYTLPRHGFELVGNIGDYVCRHTVKPDSVDHFPDLQGALQERAVDLKVMDDLSPLKTAWGHSFHASGIRLRNADSWKP